jgi:hypothetical protein
LRPTGIVSNDGNDWDVVPTEGIQFHNATLLRPGRGLEERERRNGRNGRELKKHGRR